MRQCVAVKKKNLLIVNLVLLLFSVACLFALTGNSQICISPFGYMCTRPHVANFLFQCILTNEASVEVKKGNVLLYGICVINMSSTGSIYEPLKLSNLQGEDEPLWEKLDRYYNAGKFIHSLWNGQ